MPRVRDLLYRFRPVGAPGPAAPAGVPADRQADVAAELAPLFGRLTGVERTCEAIVADARATAASIEADAAAKAQAIIDRARTGQVAERAAAATASDQRFAEECAVITAEAERAAADIRRRAAEQLPAYVIQVVRLVRTTLDVPVPGRAP